MLHLQALQMSKTVISERQISFLALVVTGVCFLLPALPAHAAPLNFATSESVTLSSPTTTFTIATGSVADALGVNATSVLVTISQTTGGSFTLLSPSYDLSVATSSGGGTASISCNAGIENVVIAQLSGTAMYTLTPTTANCANASPPIITGVTATPNSGGATITWTTNIVADSTVSYGTSTAYGATSTDATQVTAHGITLTGLAETTLYHYEVISSEYGTSTKSGDGTFTTTASLVVGVAAGYGGTGSSLLPTTATTTSAVASSSATSTLPSTTAASSTPLVSTSTVSLETEIATLTTELNALLAQVKGSVATSSSATYHFIRNLKRGDEGADVNALQKLLIREHAGVAAQALEKHGTTDYFGPLTFNALKEFQKYAGIVPASGYFGPLTRAYIAKL
jgi:hypothetical protein